MARVNFFLLPPQKEIKGDREDDRAVESISIFWECMGHPINDWTPFLPPGFYSRLRAITDEAAGKSLRCSVVALQSLPRSMEFSMSSESAFRCHSCVLHISPTVYSFLPHFLFASAIPLPLSSLVSVRRLTSILAHAQGTSAGRMVVLGGSQADRPVSLAFQRGRNCSRFLSIGMGCGVRVSVLVLFLCMCSF